MEYRQLGRNGLRVSKLCLGTMRGFVANNRKEAGRIMHAAVDQGVNFVDTADCYGESEETVGQILEEENLRRDVVLATKFGWYMGKRANDFGAGRKHIIQACEDSLRKLRTDYIDLYILHVVDPNAPWEETLRAFDTLIKQGKVRYAGTSKHPSSLLVEAQAVSQRLGVERFVSEQTVYNMLDRTPENQLMWTARHHGIGITPFSPLAGGILTGKYHPGEGAPSDSNLSKRPPGKDDRFTEAAVEAVEKLRPLANEREVSVTAFSLAWLMQQPGVTSVIQGVRKLDYLDDGIKACDLELSQEELDRVDEIVPPGQRVSKFYEPFVLAPMRQNFRADAKDVGAYIPRQETREE